MEMQQVRYAVALARTLNFTRAAEQCNVSQPSLTRAIQKLEEEFGGPLFRRERNLTHLTELGRATIPHLERTLSAAEDAKMMATEFRRQETAPLNLGLVYGLSLGPISSHIAQLGQTLRGFSLKVFNLDQADLIDRLMHGDLDAAILEHIGDLPNRFDHWFLSQDAYVTIVRTDHPLAKQKTVSLADLQRETLILQKGREMERLEALLDSNGGPPLLRHICGNLAQVKELVRAGLGSAIVPNESVLDGDLVVRPIDDLSEARDIILATVCGRRHSVALAGLVKLVRAHQPAAPSR